MATWNMEYRIEVEKVWGVKRNMIEKGFLSRNKMLHYCTKKRVPTHNPPFQVDPLGEMDLLFL